MTETSAPQPMPPEPSEPTTERVSAPHPPRPARVWDIVLTSVLIALGSVAVLLMLIPALGALVFVLPSITNTCGEASCNEAVLLMSALSSVGSPVLAMLAASIVAIVFLIKRKMAFWIVLLGIVVASVTWNVSMNLVISGGTKWW